MLTFSCCVCAYCQGLATHTHTPTHSPQSATHRSSHTHVHTHARTHTHTHVCWICSHPTNWGHLLWPRSRPRLAPLHGLDRRLLQLERLDCGVESLSRIMRKAQSQTMGAAVGPPPSRAPHDFERRREQTGWCDICDQIIWGLTHAAFVCTRCSLTAHEACTKTTRRECHGGAAIKQMRRESAADQVILAASRRSINGTPVVPDGTKKVFPTQGLLSSKSRKDVVALVDAFNLSCARGGYPLVLDDVDDPAASSGAGSGTTDDGPCTFSGRVSIQINLSKPIKVLGDAGSCNINRVVEEVVWIPRGLSKQLQLYSTMTTGDVIQGLLGKLRAMSPRSRFALYELDLASTRSRKLEDFEEPLVLVLLMGGVSQGRVLSLEDRPIEGNAWGVFASVELENFVRALDTEETRAVRTIEIEYERRKVRLKAAISKLKARPPVTL
eukprot:m.325550 g.325550  ORF g.325550 m.325550 type:complete len:440 (+) comp27649_c3_seq5:5199-6518(+)